MPAAKRKTPSPQKVLSQLSVDNVIFGYEQAQLYILLVEHGVGLSKGKWGLPGDQLGADESLDECAARTLCRRTGLENIHLRQMHTFSTVDRYPGRRIITTAYFTIINKKGQLIKASTDELEVRWFPSHATPPLIFDHAQILDIAHERLSNEARREPIGLGLLPRKFTFLQLQELYEAVLGRKFDKPNFRRKILKYQYLVDCGETVRTGNHRSASLYHFDRKKYKALTETGFNFFL